MNRSVNTIIIGAGQAGLSVSYLLTQKGIEHLVLERGKVGQSWRSNRWDSFHLITPNYMSQLPGFKYSGNRPGGFDSKNEVIKFLENYASGFKAPILENTKVTSVRKVNDQFVVKTSRGNFKSKNVVVAVGSFHQPLIPRIAVSLPKTIFQMHSSEYKNPKQLPSGPVLVVGGGNSGIQIAADLKNANRQTYLSIGRLRIVPRNYRGKDFMEWADELGILDRKTEETDQAIKDTPPPILFGNPETVDMRRLASDGIKLLGRLEGVKGNKLVFADNVVESIEKGETALNGFKDAVDKYVAEHNLKIPEEKREENNLKMPKALRQLDLNQIKSIIWATGYRDDWSWLKVETFDKNGNPIHNKGVGKAPGLCFIGLRWLSKYKSFLLCGVAEDADYVASKIIS